MIQLTAIIAGKACTMLTGESIADAMQSCKDRFGARFEGFDAIPVETIARAKWAEFREGYVSRAELDLWLKEQDEEAEIRAIFNRLRG